MRAADYARSVRHTLSSNRLRAALTLLGTVIGAASIVLLAGLLRSGEEMLTNSAQQASESDLVTVSRDLPPFDKLPKTHHELNRGDELNVEGTQLFEGARVTSESSRELLAEPVTNSGLGDRHEKDFRVRLVSSAPEALSLYRLEIKLGRGLSQEDLAQRSRVCVIGWAVWRRLFGEETPLTDQRLRVEGHEWVIVGVLKSKPLLMGGDNDGTWMWNRKVLVPQTTYDAMFQPDHGVARMYVRFRQSPKLVKQAARVEALLREVLLRTHNVENFTVKAQNSSEGQEKLILSIIKGLLLSTALLSLFVGGINIMNIMLVTVTERTREIGLRRALGATPRAITLQFLLEAVFIAGVGGAVGIVSGVGLTWVLSTVLSKSSGSFAFHIETWAVTLGFGLSLGTGVVFGLFPALRASRMDPVEALRFE